MRKLMRALRHIIGLIVAMMFSTFGTMAMPVAPMVSDQVEFSPLHQTLIAEHTDVLFTARAPPMAASEVEVTGGVTVMHGSAFALHGHDVHMASLGFGVDLDAPNSVSPQLLDPDSPYFVRIDTSHPGRPDPAYSVDTSTFTSGATTANGGIRNNRAFWSAWAEKPNASLSQSNRDLIANGRSPIVDDDWIASFPEHAPYQGQTLVHHHMDYGQYAIPLPSQVHANSPGFGIWHPPQ